jgi:hypothetical protein
MSDSPPPITDDDEVVDTKHNESNDLFFSTIGDSSDNVSDIYRQLLFFFQNAFSDFPYAKHKYWTKI